MGHTAVYLPIENRNLDFCKNRKKSCLTRKVAIWNSIKHLWNCKPKCWIQSKKMKMADMQIENLKRSITHTELTSSELKSLPQNTRLYESVGRMFILSSGPEVTNTLDTKKENSKEKIKNLEANKTYLERSLKDSENSLRELVAQRRAQ